MNERLGIGAAVLSSGGGGAVTTRHLIGAAKACVERWRQRHFLATLNEYALRDIGLNRGQIWSESERPGWWLGSASCSMPSFSSSATRPWPIRP